jgi:hypothetical protein
MKPSEIIRQEAEEALRNKYASWFERGEHQLDEFIRAILEFFDKEAEKERRRAWFRAALAVCMPSSNQMARFNTYAERAGLRTRAFAWSTVEQTVEDLIREAEQEGLI